jgi:TolB-like protein|tara:strand:- start:1365 stop:1988 length:624 start_codon:yes stop_codon:yes gene_type:complete
MLRKIIAITLANILLFSNLTAFTIKNETIAVFDFIGNDINSNTARTLSDRLRIELVKYNFINVLERSRIDAILEEQAIQMSGCVDECLVEVGKLLGATSIITGSIGKVGDYYTINARKINATTGKLENAFGYDSKLGIESLLVNGMNEVAYQIVYGEKLSNTLQVIPKEPIDPVELMMGGIFCITGGIIIWIMVLVVQIAVDVSGNL